VPKICYTPKNFSAFKLDQIKSANLIAEEYAAAGYDLTLRQLYYQFVARDLIPNSQEAYSRMGDLISDARCAGLMDWNHIIDRTRNMRKNSHWDHPRDILESAAATFAMDKWADQSEYVEVWVEKDALVGVVARAAGELDVPYFSCRGYTSQSEMWSAGQRLKQIQEKGRTPHIIHLGDHDPSGIDMSRDIKARLELFSGGKVHVLRAALNMVQVQKHRPPPNPAKVTDSRFEAYRKLYGDSSWELDALDPRTLSDIIRRAVLHFRDEPKFQERKAKEARAKGLLRTIHSRWSDLVRFLQTPTS